MTKKNARFFNAFEFGRNRRIGIYIPGKGHTSKGKEVLIDKDYWVIYGVSIFTEIFGGATLVPGLKGAWFNRDSDAPEYEITDLIYSYSSREQWEISKYRLREYAFEFASETNQGELLLEILGYYYKIRDFNLK